MVETRPLYSLDDVRGSMRFVILHGRSPNADDEIAVGPRTADVLHKGIGDTVTVGPAHTPMKVVGITLLPQTPHSSFDEGAWVQAAPLPTLTGAGDDQTDTALLLRVQGSTSFASVQADLADKGLVAELPAVPPDVANLSNVRSLPLVLAGFLALLGVGAVAHALLDRRTLPLPRPRGAARPRAHPSPGRSVRDMASSRHRPPRPPVGVPLGVVIGREIWRRLADSLSFVYVGPLSTIALLVVAPVVLGALAVLALWPARAAARLHTAEVLRSE